MWKRRWRIELTRILFASLAWFSLVFLLHFPWEGKWFMVRENHYFFFFLISRSWHQEISGWSSPPDKFVLISRKCLEYIKFFCAVVFVLKAETNEIAKEKCSLLFLFYPIWFSCFFLMNYVMWVILCILIKELYSSSAIPRFLIT